MRTSRNMSKEDNLKPMSKISLGHYNHDIQFYTTETPGHISFQDLQKLGILRLSILRIVNEITGKYWDGQPKKCLNELIIKLKQQGLESFADLFNGSGCDVNNKERLFARWRDHVSHNAVCLALSQDLEERYWLQDAEDKLIQWRVTALSNDGVKAFMRINNIQYPMVDEDEKIRLKKYLSVSTNETEKFDETTFHKVPYSEALDLIGQHIVHVELGAAYLTTSLLKYVIPFRFHYHLEMQIKSLRGRYHISYDPRVRDLIDYLRKLHKSMKTEAWNMKATRIEDLDALAVTSFPPCMRRLHEALRENHHLRNEGRVQYTLFLKSIGVPAEAAVKFFEQEFTKKMNVNTFRKEYVYYIRHLYGLVGGKKNYKVPNCTMITKYPPSDDEYHGCPIEHSDIEDLDKMFARWKVPSIHRTKITELKSNHKYDNACSAYFEATHRCCGKGSIVNPMNFYGRSREIGDLRKYIQQKQDRNDDLYLEEPNEEEIQRESD